ncbi:PIG-L deacetylase family protein [Pandoraea sputorum]|uniref:PIG-L deacetylase family protein n=1 Tax=Pandoraea sputorum TaxID=93222 RepID=UPI00123F1175|nr:PIG-L family deacetylase [Pandoraea sputorum]VVE59436.1 N-acetyl-alpha-D-glucosaminyl L-malate deacetylase 1 [Pandoraea sputorum]
MGALSARLIAGEGTAEATWQRWFTAHRLSKVTARELLARNARLHVVAPHPDDEILGCGGTLRQLARAGVEIHIWAVTDGEASHPGSSHWTPARLAEARVSESLCAQQRLALHCRCHRLGVPDGHVVQHESRLSDMLCPTLSRDDTVTAPWQLDGHPDHEAVARACRRAVQATGARGIEVPIWGWHWADPSGGDLPFERAVRVPLSDSDRAAKTHAIDAFHTQLSADPSTGALPVLPAYARARWERSFEVFLL